MIQHQDTYRYFLLSLEDPKPLSKNSIGCYIGYLESVSLWLDKHISPELISSDEAIQRIVDNLLDMGVLPSHVRNYRTAMNRYLQMTQDHSLR